MAATTSRNVKTLPAMTPTMTSTISNLLSLEDGPFEVAGVPVVGTKDSVLPLLLFETAVEVTTFLERELLVVDGVASN